MAIYIEIKKISEKNFIHYYKISTSMFKTPDFYLAIEPLKNRALFYLSTSFVDPIKIVEFSHENSDLEVPGFEQAVTGRVLLQVYRAMQKNEFPEYLSWCS
jgi:hypothetical protein